MADFTGWRRERLIGGDVIRSLRPQALELAREVRRKLLAGINVEQPYEQKITRRDGTEAIIMLTTSLIKEEGKPAVFQHISRDVTREKKLAENLRLYAQQITRTQEDERKRIARELHDDSIQALIILLWEAGMQVGLRGLKNNYLIWTGKEKNEGMKNFTFSL